MSSLFGPSSLKIGDYVVTTTQSVDNGMRWNRSTATTITVRRRGYAGVVQEGQTPFKRIDKCPHARRAPGVAGLRP